MSEIADKVKDKLKDAKDKVVDTAEDIAGKADDKITGGAEDYRTTETTATKEVYETHPTADTSEDRSTGYQNKEPMDPAKIRQHEPTAVKREMTEKIVDSNSSQTTATDSERAKEIARSKGMAKGTAGAAQTGDEYEQGAAGTNK
jgi:hypothetical protein